MTAADPSGQIAFVSGTEQEDYCVCVVDVASGAVTRVGPGRRDNSPVWSPDGEWLAFVSEVEGGNAIYMVRADGSDLKKIDHKYEWNSDPSWSPDGTRLAYVGGDQIVVYNVATGIETEWGGGIRRLARPVWVNDDSILAVGLVGTLGSATLEVFTVNQDTAEPLPASLFPPGGPYVEWAVAPHPAGNAIALELNREGDRDIFLLSLQDIPRDLSNHPTADWNPVWRPDGRALAFESFRAVRRGIYGVYPDTLRVFPIAAALDSDNWSPTWSPDSRWIAFVSNRTGDPELFVVDAEGRQLRRLTDHVGPDISPAWRPGRKP